MPSGFQITRNTISPSLARLARGIADKRPILEAMGRQLLSITVRAFRDASLRAATWPPKRDGSPATLYKRGHLKQSITITSVSNDSVHVGSDTPYAAIHQLGGTTRAHVIEASRKKFLAFKMGGAQIYAKRVNHPGSKIPARPFFPFTPDGRATALARERIADVARAKINRLR